MKWQGKSRRKFTGGRIIQYRGKKKFEIGGEAANTHLGETIRKIGTALGGQDKVHLLRGNMALVMDPKTNTSKNVKIETVTGNPANKNYVRRNIMTRGSIIRTELGSARVTNRPGQEGGINAVLIPGTD